MENWKKLSLWAAITGSLIILSGYAVGYKIADELKAKLSKPALINGISYKIKDSETNFGCYWGKIELKKVILSNHQQKLEIPELEVYNRFFKAFITTEWAGFSNNSAEDLQKFVFKKIKFSSSLLDLLNWPGFLSIAGNAEELKAFYQNDQLSIKKTALKLKLNEKLLPVSFSAHSNEADWKFYADSNFSLKASQKSKSPLAPLVKLNFKNLDLKESLKNKLKQRGQVKIQLGWDQLELELPGKSLNGHLKNFSSKISTELNTNYLNLLTDFLTDQSDSRIRRFFVLFSKLNPSMEEFELKFDASVLQNDSNTIELGKSVLNALKSRKSAEVKNNFLLEFNDFSLVSKQTRGKKEQISVGKASFNSELEHLPKHLENIIKQYEKGKLNFFRTNSGLKNILAYFTDWHLNEKIVLKDINLHDISSSFPQKIPELLMELKLDINSGILSLGFSQNLSLVELTLPQHITSIPVSVQNLNQQLYLELSQINLNAISGLLNEEKYQGDLTNKKLLAKAIKEILNEQPTLSSLFQIDTDQEISMKLGISAMIKKKLPRNLDINLLLRNLNNSSQLKRRMRELLLERSQITAEMKIDQYKRLLVNIDNYTSGFGSLFFYSSLSPWFKLEDNSMISRVEMSNGLAKLNGNYNSNLQDLLVRIIE